MSRAVPSRAPTPHRAAPFRRALPGLAVTLLPALPYEVRYRADEHVIGFTLAPQQGTHAFASDRRRPFFAHPWRLAVTPAGCDVFSASPQGGEYLVITVAQERLARLAPEHMPG